MTVFNRPFLKWAGGKSRVLSRIQQVLPKGKRLIEPFVGSGSVFLNTDYESYLAADINPDLIHLYQLLKQNKKPFIDYCSEFFVEKNNQQEAYYELRQLFNDSPMGELRGALFLYLNRHGFNGLCRYNLKGGYNVPFGRYKKPYFPEKEMVFFTEHAAQVTFVCDDFRQVILGAEAGDVVYCDPPYVPSSETAYFTQYAPKDFSLSCQRDLAETVETAVSRGVAIVISNHDNEITRKLYQNAEITSFLVQRQISSKANERTKAQEMLACFYPKK